MLSFKLTLLEPFKHSPKNPLRIYLTEIRSGESLGQVK